MSIVKLQSEFLKPLQRSDTSKIPSGCSMVHKTPCRKSTQFWLVRKQFCNGHLWEFFLFLLWAEHSDRSWKKILKDNHKKPFTDQSAVSVSSYWVNLRGRRSELLPPANEVWGKVIFSVACVKNSVHRRGLTQCMLGYHPPRTRPPGSRPVPRSRSPWVQTPPRSTPPWEQTPPQSRHPLGADTPWSRHPPSRHPPPEQCMLGDTVNKRAVCILLECNLVHLLIRSPKLFFTVLHLIHVLNQFIALDTPWTQTDIYKPVSPTLSKFEWVIGCIYLPTCVLFQD